MHNVRLLYCEGASLDNLANVARISTGSSEWDGGDPERVRNDAARLVSACFHAWHLSVFEFCDFTFLVDCPIFVARQLMRYRCASYIERSLRRCEPLPGDPTDDAYAAAVELYSQRTADGTKKEDARAVLTLSTPTRFLWKLNGRELFHVFDERLGRGVQSETRAVVRDMYNEVLRHAPQIVSIWEGGRDHAEN